jgi:hypothetical protein
VKTSLLCFTDKNKSRFPRWRWDSLYGGGKESKGAQRIIPVASHRLRHARGLDLKTAKQAIASNWNRSV